MSFVVIVLVLFTRISIFGRLYTAILNYHIYVTFIWLLYVITTCILLTYCLGSFEVMPNRNELDEILTRGSSGVINEIKRMEIENSKNKVDTIGDAMMIMKRIIDGDR